MKTSGIRISTNEKIGLINNLATMLTAGIPILEAVDSLLEDSKGGQKKILETLMEDLKQGKPIHQSLEKYPKVFNKVSTNLIKASEEGGTLDTTLQDLVVNIRKETEFSDKVKSAMIYPLFIMVIFTGVMILMLTFVIPRIASVFSKLKVDIPLPTQIMINTSNLLLTYTIPIVIGFIILSVLVFFIYRAKREVFINVIFSLPVVSGLMRQVDVTRFSRSLYLLLSSGIPITSSLELCQDVVLKKDVHKAIVQATQTVTSGHPLSDAFKQNRKVFPTIMIKMTEAGEKTGSLDKSMQDTSDYMDYEVSKTLKKVTTLMEPIMLVVVGISIGGMMLAIIAPMYSIIGQVSQR